MACPSTRCWWITAPCLWEEQRPATRTVHCHQVDGSVQVSAPLPGLLVEVRVAEGQRVGEGEVVAVLESMKMHLEICVPRDGVVQAVHGVARTEVAQGEVLVVIGPPSVGLSPAGC